MFDGCETFLDVGIYCGRRLVVVSGTCSTDKSVVGRNHLLQFFVGQRGDLSDVVARFGGAFEKRESVDIGVAVEPSICDSSLWFQRFVAFLPGANDVGGEACSSSDGLDRVFSCSFHLKIDTEMSIKNQYYFYIYCHMNIKVVTISRIGTNSESAKGAIAMLSNSFITNYETKGGQARIGSEN